MRQSPLRTMLIWGLAALAVVIFGGYSLFEARKLIMGPEVTISTPQDGATIASTPLHVTGTVQNTAFLTVNDVQVLADAQGNFDTSLTPPPGYEILKVTATDRFGRTKTTLLHVGVAPNASATASSTPL